MRFKKKCVGLIIENNAGELLLQLRDNTKGILFPNTWTLFGGAIEADETPVDAIQREIQEELCIIIKNPELVDTYVYAGHDGIILQYIFKIKKNILYSDVTLTEGADLRYFTEEEIKHITLGFNMRKILDEYFTSKKD